MVNFPTTSKIKGFFTAQRRQEVLSLQLVIDNEPYYVRLKAGPFFKTNLNTQTAVSLLGRNGAVALYQIDRQTREGASSRYEMVIEMRLFDLELSLKLSDNIEVAEQHLHGHAIPLLNAFLPYLYEKGKKTLLENVGELLECYVANPKWTMTHYAANFAWELFFKEKPSLEEVEDTSTGSNVLHVAIGSGNNRIIDSVLSTGMDVNIPGGNGWTAMHYAVFYDSPQTVSFLVSKQAFYEQLRLSDNDGYTPIDLAFKNGHFSSIQRLMLQGLTAKMLNVSREKADSRELYRDFSPYVTFTQAEVNHFAVEEFKLGGCPLHWVDDFALLDRLLQLDVFKTNQRNSLGDTPLITFIKRLSNEPAGSLDSTVSKITSSKTTNKSSRKGASQDFKKSKTAESQSTGRSHGNDRLCWLLRLIIAGGRPNSQNLDGDTALHFAVRNHDIASVQMLIIFGARVNLRNKDNCSVLHLASTFLEQLKKRSGTSKSATDASLTNLTCSSILALNDKDIVRSKQHFTQIIQLLVESHARKCSIKMKACGVDCVSKGTSTFQTRSKSPKELINILFQVCFTEQTRLQMEKATNENTAQEEDMEKGEKGQTTNLLVFDGGDSMEGIRPLIQTLIINEIQEYLKYAFNEYFDVIAGVSFGSTAGALVAINRTPLEAFYFFMKLKENFKWPIMSSMNENAAFLEYSLQQEIGTEKSLEDVPRLHQRHLMLFTTLVDREPVLQKMLHSFPVQPAFSLGESDLRLPLWKACRAAGCGLYCYKTFESHYDGSLHAANPTLDALTHFEALSAELSPPTMTSGESQSYQEASHQMSGHHSPLPPLGLVLSIGCGSRLVKENIPVNDLPTSKIMLNTQINYYTSLRNIIFRSMLEQDSFVAERARVWCESVQANYGRVNFSFDHKLEKTYLHNVTAGTLRSMPSATLDDGKLLQILWNVKLQMLENKYKFKQLAKYLEMMRKPKGAIVNTETSYATNT